jgi:predicted dithiol-disulfide oxidoreductase (DUF899 family)
MFTDQIGHLAHINARDTTLALVSRASQQEIADFKRRMGWSVPWYTVVGEDFQKARGTTEYFSLDVYLRDGDRVFLAYETRGRGVEALGSVWTFLDLTPLGRQEGVGGHAPRSPAVAAVPVVAPARRVLTPKAAARAELPGRLRRAASRARTAGKR